MTVTIYLCKQPEQIVKWGTFNWDIYFTNR